MKAFLLFLLGVGVGVAGTVFYPAAAAYMAKNCPCHAHPVCEKCKCPCADGHKCTCEKCKCPNCPAAK